MTHTHMHCIINKFKRDPSKRNNGAVTCCIFTFAIAQNTQPSSNNSRLLGFEIETKKVEELGTEHHLQKIVKAANKEFPKF